MSGDKSACLRAHHCLPSTTAGLCANHVGPPSLKNTPPHSPRQESLHWLPFPAPRKWLMHLVYIITNVLFALQLNCDCYVQSMGKGHGIAPASALMEKSMRIHFNHCGCGRMSTTLRDCQWPRVITAVYTRFCFGNLDIHKSLCFLAPPSDWGRHSVKWWGRRWRVRGPRAALIVRLSVRLAPRK